MLAFLLATGTPLILLTLAAFLPGPIVWITLAYLALLAPLTDRHTARFSRPRSVPLPEAFTTWLPRAMALCHFALFLAALTALAGTAHGTVEKIALILAFGAFFGQTSNAIGHELIHRQDRISFWLGASLFATHLFAHHASAHRLVHHIHVATPGDPNSAAKGETLYRFIPRAWRGSFVEGLKAEMRLRRVRNGFDTPFPAYVLLSFLWLLLVFLIIGPIAVPFAILLGAHAAAQLLTSDYVQHYGLERRDLGDGRFEAVGTGHSWNAGQPVSNFFMIFSPRHSDHHLHPGRHFNRLSIASNAPLLPYSLPVMGVLALFPRRFHRTMDPRVEAL